MHELLKLTKPKMSLSVLSKLFYYILSLPIKAEEA